MRQTFHYFCLWMIGAGILVAILAMLAYATGLAPLSTSLPIFLGGNMWSWVWIAIGIGTA
jgi:hypothetical protein